MRVTQRAFRGGHPERAVSRRSGIALAMLLAVGSATALPAQAQMRLLDGVAPSGSGGGEAEMGILDEITPAERKAIRRQIDANVADLARRGALPRLTIPVVFGWPLAPMPGFTDYGYHATSFFVDHDPAHPDQLLDYDCGTRTYDLRSGYNHSGVDFVPWPFGWKKMRGDQIAVVAAAPGIITARFDGAFDRSCRFGGGLWNAVYVQHADGSQAWYGHLKRGSLTTKSVGESVARGEYLGIIGSSGSSLGPHLHLEIYDAASNLIDPYSGPCNSLNGASWWLEQLPYYDSAINHLATGFAPPSFNPCPDPESPNEADSFNPDDPIYLVSYYRDQLSSQTARHTLYRPDGSTYSSWLHASSASHYPASFWYWMYVLPGPTGNWRYEIEFEGETYTREFLLDDAVPPRTCGSTPATGCEAPRKSKLIVKDKEGSRDNLTWSFLKGAPAERSAFGDPPSTDTAAFCVYDSSASDGSEALALDALLTPGPDWSSSGTGFKYRDPSAAHDGIKLVKLKAGKAGSPKPVKVLVKGKGAGLDDPLARELALPVRAQLMMGNGSCFEDVYDGAARNDTALFKASR